MVMVERIPPRPIKGLTRRLSRVYFSAWILFPPPQERNINRSGKMNKRIKFVHLFGCSLLVSILPSRFITYLFTYKMTMACILIFMDIPGMFLEIK